MFGGERGGLSHKFMFVTQTPDSWFGGTLLGALRIAEKKPVLKLPSNSTRVSAPGFFGWGGGVEVLQWLRRFGAAESISLQELHETCIGELSRRHAIRGWTVTPTHASDGEITTLTCVLMDSIDDMIVVKVVVKIDRELNVREINTLEHLKNYPTLNSPSLHAINKLRV